MKNTRLKAARAELDLTQQQLADEVGVSRRTIHLVEAGGYNPTLALCVRICKRLGKSLNDLFWQTMTLLARGMLL